MEKTVNLVQAWIRTRKAVERCRAQLLQAEEEKKIAENHLGEWLVPAECVAEVETGQPFHIWHGSGVLTAKKDMGVPGYRVYWSKEPDGKDRLEMGF